LHCHRAFAEGQERVVIFRIADTDDLMRRQSEFVQRRAQTRGFVV
jgi:hypothetical protein